MNYIDKPKQEQETREFLAQQEDYKAFCFLYGYDWEQPTNYKVYQNHNHLNKKA